MPRSDDDRSELGSVRSFATFSEASTWSVGGGEQARKPAAKQYKFAKRFAYQKLKGWRPILKPRNAELFFLAAGVLLLALGVPVLVASLNVVEVRVPYAFAGDFAGLDADARQELLWANSERAWPDGEPGGVRYTVPVTIPDRMEPPIYVVVELGSFFQNFRRYVRSFDPARMHDGGDASPASACNPFAYLDGNTSLPINPCGQIANSFFNDSFAFAVSQPGGGGGGGGAPTPLPVDSSDIAWSSDANHLYGPVPAINYNLGSPAAAAALRGGNTSEVVLNQNQHWMVWMRPHSQVAVQKLWGVINAPLEAGAELQVEVTNRYNTYAFNGAKTVIVTTNSWVGGRNVFLGACYLAVGGLCLLTALAFFLGYDLNMVWKRPYGDMANVSWLRQHASELKQQQQSMRAAGSSPAPAPESIEGPPPAEAPAADGGSPGAADRPAAPPPQQQHFQ